VRHAPGHIMKRYRVLSFDFDSNPSILKNAIEREQEGKATEQHRKSIGETIAWLRAFYGETYIEQKIQNYIDLGAQSISILAFHNKFFRQARNAFVIRAYYPALTSIGALGERILNHLMIKLRDYYKSTPEYKKIHNKGSFDDWRVPIDVLSKWSILLPEVAAKFEELRVLRNDTLHFRPETDSNDRILALKAIHCMEKIISRQFSALEGPTWFIPNAIGEAYIRKDQENVPFIKAIYLPVCNLVGYRHQILAMTPRITINDDFDYPMTEVSDEEYLRLRRKPRSNG
jgi:hypothetical protein